MTSCTIKLFSEFCFFARRKYQKYNKQDVNCLDLHSRFLKTGSNIIPKVVIILIWKTIRSTIILYAGNLCLLKTRRFNQVLLKPAMSGSEVSGCYQILQVFPKIFLLKVQFNIQISVNEAIKPGLKQHNCF